MSSSFSEWREVSLEEIVDILGDGLHGTPKYDENGDYYFINGNNLNGNIIIDEKTKKVNHEEFLKYKKDLNERTILVSINGTLGNVAFYNGEKVVLGKSACYFNVKENYSKEYIKYILLSSNFKNYINTYSTGTTIKNMGLKQMRAFRINIPKISEQKAIAHILSTLDEKIEVNNQINKTLENIAQTIFKQWFVDFEFPNGAGEPYKSSGGEMVESELGMIPKGWEVSNFDKVIKITSGKRPKEREEVKQNNHIYPLVGASSIMGYTTEYNFDEEIIVIGRVGTHGIIQRFKDKIWASDNTLVIKSIFIEYTNQILKMIDYKSLNRGSTQPLITQTDIKNHKIILPCESIINKYEEIISVNSEMIDIKNTENQKLKELRDSLLPKLMSGEIRVPIEEN